MAKLKWDKAGNHYFETGVDRGVLYPESGNGVVWNGLVSVSENPSGGEASPYYSDGIKYLNLMSTEEFAGSIEAYTYPDEFAQCDGTESYSGLQIHQQTRKSFSLSYRTLIGNDIDGQAHGYKIHLVYNAMAAPADREYSTLTDDPEALTFSWEFTTTPVIYTPPLIATPLGSTTFASPPTNKLRGAVSAFSHITIDSRKTRPVTLRLIEETLYGTSKTAPKMLTVTELFELFDSKDSALNIVPNYVTGFSPIIDLGKSEGDLLGSLADGIYSAPPETSLKKTPINGVQTLE